MNSPVDKLPRGTIVGRWRLGNRLGHGRSGEVYEAFEIGGGRRRAVIKIRRGRSLKEDIRFFDAEIEFLQRRRFPTIMPELYDRYGPGETPYFVMQRFRPIPKNPSLKAFKRIVLQLVDAFELLWSEHYLHRDIKPQNVCFFKGKVYVIDYGTVIDLLEHERQLRLNPNQAKEIVGTPRYIAPDIFLYGKSSVVTEIYSLALTVEDICPEPFREIFRAFFGRAASTEAKDRPQSYAEFREQFLAAEEEYRAMIARESRLPKFKTAAKTVGKVVVGAFLTFLVVMGIVHTVRLVMTLRVYSPDIKAEVINSAAKESFKLHDHESEIISLEQLAVSGHFRAARACHILSQRYLWGKGCEKDPMAAEFWAERAKREQKKTAERKKKRPAVQ